MLSERKNLSEHLALEPFPDPRTVVIPLSQHAGAPAEPLVKAGDRVKAGRKIGEAVGELSSTIHASITGTVTAVEPRMHPLTASPVMSVVIQSDLENNDMGDYCLDASVCPADELDSLTADEIRRIVREKGIVGMGGGAFSTAVKLDAQKPIDTVLLNGCECEPLLTADHRVMLEYPDQVIFGLKAMLRGTGAKKGIIAIEDNKYDAIKLIQKKTEGSENIVVFTAKTKYPQGAEKILIKRVLGREVPSGGLPKDMGVMVSNVSTAKAVSDAIQIGLPLIERVITVTGEKIKKPGNYIVKIGTSVKEIIEHCGGVTEDEVTVKLGGPMMGIEVKDLDVPIIKGTGGIIAVDPDVSEPTECIRCGRCVDVCPMELFPLYFSHYQETENRQYKKNITDCIECGCCQFICPSKRPIVSQIKQAKKES